MTALSWLLLLVVACAEFNLLHIPRSRLRQLAAAGNRSAHLADDLLRQPERLRGVARLVEVLLLVGIAGSSAVALTRAWPVPAAAVGLLCVAVLATICLQWLPQQLRSEREWMVVIAARLFAALIVVFGPVVAAFDVRNSTPSSGTRREARATNTAQIAADDHRALHERVADLDNITVDDIMIPRNDLAIIDAEDAWDDILTTLRSTPHTRLPLCENGIDNIIGVVHMKKVAHALARGELTREVLIEIARAREPYFTPEGTTLSDQLVNFKRDRRRVALVVDEYGDIQGLVTLEDILEEVVGEFTTSPTMLTREVHRESENTYVVSGSASVRDLNRALGWTLPVDGPRTLNGLIVETLETIPQPGTTFRVGNLAIEILQTAENAVRSARVRPIEDAEALPELSKGVA
ncbi:MAG: transporter associated domain-containing protein [Steroidobacteraceae bacterium]